MKTHFSLAAMAAILSGTLWFSGNCSLASEGYQIFVSNEKSGDLTVISGGDFKVTATIPVGKRPRGIHAGPDGKTVYVALSGTPIEPPPQLAAAGNPILKKIPTTTMTRPRPTNSPPASASWMRRGENFCAKFRPAPIPSSFA